MEHGPCKKCGCPVRRTENICRACGEFTDLEKRRFVALSVLVLLGLGMVFVAALSVGDNRSRAKSADTVEARARESSP